ALPGAAAPSAVPAAVALPVASMVRGVRPDRTRRRGVGRTRCPGGGASAAAPAHAPRLSGAAACHGRRVREPRGQCPPVGARVVRRHSGPLLLGGHPLARRPRPRPPPPPPPPLLPLV